MSLSVDTWLRKTSMIQKTLQQKTSQAEKQREHNDSNKQNVKEVWVHVSKEVYINWNRKKEQSQAENIF